MVALHPEIEKSEVDALCELFLALGGTRWTNSTGWTKFDNAEALRSGYGMAWYGTKWSKGCVISIDLRGNNLRGTLPDVFSKMNKLQVLNLGNNPLVTGRVPHSLMKAKHLQYCYLDGTQVFDIVASHHAYDFHITKYISSSKASVRVRIRNSTWIADVTEQEMYLVSTSLQAARAPPRPNVIQRTAHNATGPERVHAAMTLQRIYRESRARRKILKLSAMVSEVVQDVEDIKSTQAMNRISMLGATTSLIHAELKRRYGSESSTHVCYRGLFDEYDQEHTGFVHSKDLLLLCGDLGIPMSPQRFEIAMKEMNTPSHGKLSFEELCHWLDKMEK
ncbi:hypothetical protein H257_18491 [Aphanomyces astaci]|uniref:EF-hand domain-containing protein n=1 Tax=Aphanomyces astaci TaxID=112090 RepID=W4FD88_APHAT|nr:hypothetical protein H257_18491 [Aphanomyces astaci]ETV64668.1 hypothetical protein H257_18491 [Aphanomyces astaci]|eukprot:XP_009845864.1 hypothetical protein H257_18491 [Aphanomyces astaci]